MNAELLLTHYDRISDAPDAVVRLRQFIFNLAVLGKLVEQDPMEKPATDLLIQNDSVRQSVAKNDHRADFQRQEFLAKELVWETPRTWVWSAMADAFLFIDYRGKTPSKIESGVRLLTAKNVRKGFIDLNPEEFLSEVEYDLWMTRGFPAQGDLLFTTEAPMGNAAVIYLSERFALAQRVICFRPYGGVNPEFLSLQIRSEQFQNILSELSTGLTAKGIKAAKLKRIPIAVPTLAEQHRIVAKVDELMALCDRLEASRREQETRRDQLAASAHHHLNNCEDVEEFRTHTQFFVGHLPRLTTHPDQIKQLRQTILNLAVRGKLVHQFEGDESVATLFRNIQEKQKQLINQRVIKKRIYSDTSLSEEALIDIPETWQFTALGKLLVFGPQNGISPTASSRPDAPSSITLTATTSGTFKSDFYKQIEANVPLDSEFWLRDGDLLFQRGNTREYVGIAAYYDGEPGVFLYPDLIIKVRLSKFMDLRYVHLCCVAPYARDYFGRHASGAQASMPKINHDILINLPIPVPPLAAQHRIVTKVDELMALCDKLETSLRTTKTESSRLLESVLHHALEASA